MVTPSGHLHLLASASSLPHQTQYILVASASLTLQYGRTGVEDYCGGTCTPRFTLFVCTDATGLPVLFVRCCCLVPYLCIQLCDLSQGC